MSKSLVIVESPSKAKTINKYLGKDFRVIASVGHIKDLPKKGLGVDVENNFEPTYEVMPGKEKVVREVKDAFNHPGKINDNLVDAQQARRVLDRLVGYKVSPLLWDKVRRGLSAGRVQTVA